MDRRCPSFLILLALLSLLVLSGCVGKGSKDQSGTGTQTVTLNPGTSVSLELGRSQNFTATARDGNGQSVFSPVHYASDNNASLTISNDGRACAGTWNSLSSPVVCSPGVAGVAKVTATVDGVTSAPTTVYVHQHIQSISIAPAQARQCPRPDITFCPCFSQGEITTLQASAMGANNVDITNTLGPLNWASTNTNVVTVDSTRADLQDNQVRITAKNPGVTKIFANISGTFSTPFDLTTCLVKSIKLQVQNDTSNSVTINAGSTKALVAEVVDTLDTVLNNPPITWNTSNPEVASVSTSGTVTGKQEGGIANISASCTPPNCNIGVLPGMPIYSTGGRRKDDQPAFGVITTRVLQSKPPTGTAWTATTDCDSRFNCNSVMFPVTPGNTPIGAGVTLPSTPNSLLFHPNGTRVYVGSNKGLMFVDVGAQPLSVTPVSPTSTPCNIAVCGKLLAISADGTKIVVSDTETIPNQVYIWDAAHGNDPPVNLLVNGATSAAFSPDQMKLFITTNDGKLFVHSTVDSLRQVATAAPANGINFAADSSFAYVAGTPSQRVSGYATCDLQNIGADRQALPVNPILVFPLPSIREDQVSILDPFQNMTTEHSVLTQDLLALEPPNIQLLTAQFTRHELTQPEQLACNPPFFFIDEPEVDYHGFTAGDSFNLGQGNFTPLFTQLTGDGSKVIVVAQNIPAVLLFDVASKTTSAFPLTDGAIPRAATATLDGTQIFVAACQTFADDDATPPYKRCTSGGSVHIVKPLEGGDVQQVVYTNVGTSDSMCTNLDADHPCTPNLVAVRPQ